MKSIYLGGADIERLFLKDAKFVLGKNSVIVKRTKIPGINMPDLIARHKGRYALLGLYLRPGYHMLDFPCGSGYAANMLKEFGVMYYGLEMNPLTVEYARRIYGGKHIHFTVADLRKPKLASGFFDTIGCIEGLEHIEKKFQSPLIAAFKKALKRGGTLVVSSPESSTGVSGPHPHNQWHKWELTRGDFLGLLRKHFKRVEFVTHQSVLSTGMRATCYYGICHKE